MSPKELSPVRCAGHREIPSWRNVGSSGRAVITEERLNWRAVLVLLVLAGVLAYTTFQMGRGGANRSVSIPSSLGPAGDVVEFRSFTGRMVAASWPCSAMGNSTPASVCAVAGSPFASGGAARCIASADRGDGRAGASRSESELRFADEQRSQFSAIDLLERNR